MTRPSRFTPEELLEHLDWIRALARQLVSDQEAAQDLAQDACVVALRSGPDDPAQTRTWLAAVVRNLLWQRIRRTGRRTQREQSAARGEALDASDVLVERIEAQRELARHVVALGERYRVVVLMRYYEALPPREIAKRLNLPVTTVSSRLAHALRILRHRLGRSMGDDPRVWSALLLPIPRDIGILSMANVGGVLVNAKVAVLATALLVAGAFLTLAVIHDAPAGGHPSALPVKAADSPAADQIPEPASDLGGDDVLGGRRSEVEPGAASSASSEAPKPEDPPTPSDRSVREVAQAAVEGTLNGVIDASAFLDLALAIAEHDPSGDAVPVADPAGSVRFPIEGVPEGMSAELVINRSRSRPRAGPLLSLGITLELPGERYLAAGVARSSSEIQIAAFQDAEGALERFTVLTGMLPSVRNNRDLAIPWTSGRVPIGMLYSFNVKDPFVSSCRMRWLDEGMPVDEPADVRVVGGAWPRMRELEMFSKRLLELYSEVAE